MRRCDCGAQIGERSKSGMCMSCSTKARWADPRARAEQSRRIREALADPARGARMLRAGTSNMLKGHLARKGGGGLAGKLPEDRRAEFDTLKNKVGHRAAYDMIMEDEAIKERRRLARERDLSA